MRNRAGTLSPASDLAQLRLRLGLLAMYRNRMGPERLAYARAVESIAAVTASIRAFRASVVLVRYPSRAIVLPSPCAFVPRLVQSLARTVAAPARRRQPLNPHVWELTYLA